MSFNVDADAYDRFMGRYSVELAPQMAEFAGIEAGKRVVDVGCGPGALTAELVARGAQVSAAEPSPSFVEAARTRYPSVDVRQASAEDLPFEDNEFDAALAQLVVHFMADPAGGIAEMARVTRTGGVVAASVWDMGGGQAPLSPYWRAARELDSGVQGEDSRAGAAEGQLRELFTRVGLNDVEEAAQTVHVDHATFEEWWRPFTLGVGPAGQHYQQLDADRQKALEERLRDHLGEPVRLETRAWAARGIV
ncbi:MAG: class I SAM-dependent methyltransferase [Gaiellaceae bacterium]